MFATVLYSFLLVAASSQAMTDMGQAAAVECPVTPAPPPAGMEGWARKTPLRAGATAAQATALVIGRAAVATLLPTAAVTYAVRPGKPGAAIGSGGLFAVTVATAGRYRVALGSAAWVDVLAGTTPAISVAHGHGPDCTGLRKTVDFDLQPGRYLVQVVGSATPSLPLMVSRVS